MHRLTMLLLCVLFPVLLLTVVEGQSPSGSASIWDNIVSKWNTLLSFFFKNRLSTSCQRDIPKTATVHGIEYGSEEPWIPNGENATIFCSISPCKNSKVQDKVPAECLRGVWQYEPCKDCSILLIGGYSSLTSLEWFNPWDPTQNRVLATKLPTGKYDHISAVLDDGRVLIAGGSDVSSFLFDPMRERFMDGPALSTRRSRAGAAVVDGIVYICGGNRKTCERFQSGAWHNIPPMSTAREQLAMAALDGTVYVIGGYSPILSLVEAFDVQTERWTVKTPMPTARAGLAATVWQKTIIACGGHNNWEHLNVCEKYDVEADRWSAIASMKKGRYLFSLVSVGDWLVALGGRNGALKEEDTAEIYDPNKDQWQFLSHTKFANKRYRHSAVVI